MMIDEDDEENIKKELEAKNKKNFENMMKKFTFDNFGKKNNLLIEDIEKIWLKYDMSLEDTAKLYALISLITANEITKKFRGGRG